MTSSCNFSAGQQVLPLPAFDGGSRLHPTSYVGFLFVWIQSNIIGNSNWYDFFNMSNGKRGAPTGNQNRAKARVWTAAIERALDRRVAGEGGLKAIDELAEKFIELCFQGDLAFLKEFGDRMEGRPNQSIDVTTDAPPISPELTYETARRIMFVLEQGAKLADQKRVGGSPGATQH